MLDSLVEGACGGLVVRGSRENQVKVREIVWRVG